MIRMSPVRRLVSGRRLCILRACPECGFRIMADTRVRSSTLVSTGILGKMSSRQRTREIGLIRDKLIQLSRRPQEGALVSEHGQRGASPLQADVLRPVADRNCVVARRGGEHREANGLASLPSCGEAQIGAIRKSTTLKGNVSKRSSKQSGGWRRNGWKSRFIKPRDLPSVRPQSAGVRGTIVALRPGNAGGAKGSRKMDA